MLKLEMCTQIHRIDPDIYFAHNYPDNQVFVPALIHSSNPLETNNRDGPTVHKKEIVVWLRNLIKLIHAKYLKLLNLVDVINNRLKVDIYPYYLYNDSKACILCFYFYVGLYENYLDIKLRDPNMEIVSLCIGKFLHTHRITIVATVCVKKTATSFAIK